MATLNSLVSEKQLTTIEDTLLSTNSTEKKFVGAATVTNTSASEVEVTFWRMLLATAGTTGSGGNWAIQKTIPAKATVRLDKLLGQALGFSMKISALASVTGVVNVDMSGTTET